MRQADRMGAAPANAPPGRPRGSPVPLLRAVCPSRTVPAAEHDDVDAEGGGGMTVRLLVGDCRDKLRELPDNSVHVCVTSPPYMGLRSYLPDVVKMRDDLTDDERAYVL